MTDRELIVAAAERVMGWPRVEMPSFSKAAVRWQRGPDDYPLVWWNDDVHITQMEGWNPLESDGDVFMLVDRLVSSGLEVIVGCFPQSACVEIRRWRNRQSEGIPGDPTTGRVRETFVCQTGGERRRVIVEACVRPEVLAALRAVGVLA